MMHFVSLDTNIYRQLGIDFWNKSDFRNLKKFLDQRAYEIIMTDVVHKELIDFYSTEVIKPLIGEYNKVFQKMDSTPLFKKPIPQDLTPNEQDAKQEYIKTIRATCFKIITTYVTDSNELIDFLIGNKHETKKDNTRDFIIFKTLLLYAHENPKDKIILISNDKIFTENKFFANCLKSYSVTNFLTFDSIASYLNEFGYKFDFLTDDLVLKSIKTELIKREILKDVKCLPSYIIRDYNNLDSVPELQDCKIDEIKIYEYYAYRNEKEKLKIAISVLVRIIAVFSPDMNKDYRNYNIERYYEENHNRIDQFNRPIYDNNVLLILEGDLNETTKKINRVRFIDFIPDYNVKSSYA
jgi:hypothetical protein